MGAPDRARAGGRRRVGAASLLVYGAVAAAYFGAAKLGLELSVAHGVITPVWPPTAIALVALLVGGPRLWPAVAVGAFAANATSGTSAAVAAAIAVGNTLEPLVAVALLRRVGFRPTLERARDVVALATLAAFVATAVAATNGVTALAIADSPAADPYGSAWALWWLGDAMGAVLVAPLLLVLATWPPSRRLAPERVAEAAILFAALAAASIAVFHGGLWRYPWLVFPLLVLATLRFHQLGAAAGSFVVAGFAVAGVVSGSTPLRTDDATTEVQILQALIAFVAVSLLVLGATLAERDRAEEALRRANEGLAEAQQLAHIGSWSWDVADNRVAWSDELHRIFRVPPEEALTYERYLQRVHPDDRTEVRAAIERALADGSSFEFVHRIVLGDGGVRHIHSRGHVAVDSSGRPVRMLGTAQDVTERRRLEQVRENVLVTVSHELRTPLTSVLGFALTLERLEGELGPEQRRELLRHLAEQGRKLERLLEDLLDLDRLRHDGVRLERARTDVAELVRRVVGDVAGGDGNPIELELTPTVADVDGAKVERIVENLVANAVKHTPPRTPITVSLARRDGGVVIGVDDAGDGVPAELRAAVFELFERGDPTGGVPGAGIGLALVAQYAELHGGRAWVEESAAGGAGFRVFLPDAPRPS